MNYISLHNHSEFSLFDGFQKPKQMVERAKELGMTAISLTDHGTLSGVMPFYKACKEAGIKPIIGLEAYLVPDASIKERGYFHLILLCKNNTGYRNLLKLDTLAYQNLYYKPRIDMDMLRQYHEGLICTSACIQGPLNTDNAMENARELYDIFGDDFYVEIQPNSMPEQNEYNAKLVSLIQQMGLPIVVTTDAHYSRIEDAKYHRLWVNINKSDNEYYTTDDYYIMDENDIRQRLLAQGSVPKDMIDNAIDNTAFIADQCNVTIEVEGNHYPVFPTDDPVEEVKKICRQGWVNAGFNQLSSSEYKERQERFLRELPALDKGNYLNYMLITQDILNWCESQNIMTGPGRGSSGGSIVSFLMNITKIDPVKHKLLFERFFNPERITPPDIDNDVSKQRRQEVIEYIKQKYGHVYNIRTFNELQAKGALQRAGQALKLEPQMVISMSKNIESLDDVDGNEELVDVARKFEGLIHAFGCHASAVLVFPDDPTNYCPIEKQGDTYLASYDYHDLEEMGLLKLDMLGLNTLDVIQETLSLIPDRLDANKLPLEDPDVYQLYANGTTTGVFQTESNGMRHFAKQMKVDRFDDIVALVALFRPGPLDSGMAQQYIDGKNGGTITYLHPSLEPILKDTYGVIVFQEQVISIAQTMAGMTPGQADLMRKVIGRKELDKIKAVVEDFVEKSVANGYQREVAQEIGRQIEACGRYIFNRSHAAEYGYISYITAYLKTKYPVEFMVSLLNSEIGDIEKTVEYIQECRRMNIDVLPPSIQYSKQRYSIEGNAIRFGLNAIKGVGSKEFTPATSFDEFIQLNPSVDNGTLESLIKAGAFPESRSWLMDRLTWLKENKQRIKQCNTKIAEFTEKGNIKKVDEWKLRLSLVPEFIPSNQKVDESHMEREVLGMYLTTSPLSIYSDKLSVNTWTYQQFAESGKGSMVIVAGLVKKMRPHIDKNNNKMGFVDIETIEGETIGITFFSKAWERECEKIAVDGIIRVKGKKDVDSKMLGDVVEKIR